MKLSTHSKKHINIFSKHNCAPRSQTDYTEPTERLLEQFYNDLLDAQEILDDVKKQCKKRGTFFYTKKVTKILSSLDIIKGHNFGGEYLPKHVVRQIDGAAQYTVDVHFQTIFNRKVRVVFTSEEESDDPIKHPEVYDKYVSWIYMWITMIHHYAKMECSQSLTIYLYLTTLKKEMPRSKDEVIGVPHVNTAYTRPCSEPSEIIIYRKEEWEKVMLHESFHNFALDFSTSPSNECVKRMLKLFPINSNITLFEAYTESWAEILNMAFCSFFKTHALTRDDDNKRDDYDANLETFLSHFQEYSSYEINYSMFQMVKMLDHMGLNYESTYSTDIHLSAMRKHKYKEDSHIFAYYIAKMIILFHYQDFLIWCQMNNRNVLQFSASDEAQHSFCEFIEQHYDASKLVASVKKSEKLFTKLKMHYSEDDIVFRSARMTMCEKIV